MRTICHGVILPAALLLWGCAGTSTIETDAPTPWTTEAASTERSLAARDVMPWLFDAEARAHTARYLIVEGEHAGDHLLEVREPIELDGGGSAWKVTREAVAQGADAGSGEVLNERVFAIADDRGIVLDSMVNHARGVIVEFDPKMRSMPESLEPGAPFERESDVRLPKIANPEQLRDQGSAKMTLELLGAQRVTTPMSSFEALRSLETFITDTRFAKATRTIERWIAPDTGVVAERWSEDVKALGLFGGSSRQAILLLDSGK